MIMKKIVIIAFAAVVALPLFAGERLTPEERATADYSAWLPAAGDFQIGFSLDPIVTIGNAIFSGGVTAGAFHGGQNGAAGTPAYDFTGEGMRNNIASIMGSYMLTNNLGIKANIGFNLLAGHDAAYVNDDAALFYDPLSRAKVEDRVKYKDLTMSLGLGAEYRVGKKRIQGVFGGGVMYGFTALNEVKFSYGNQITAANQAPTIDAGTLAAAWGPSGFGYIGSIADMPNARTTKVSSNGAQWAGVYGTIGVEYFVAPKVSVGLNVNLNICYEWTNQTYAQVEGWSTVESIKRTDFTELIKPMEGRFEFSTKNIGANLYMAFYFGK